jgi:organic radical activating enzyme
VNATAGTEPTVRDLLVSEEFTAPQGEGPHMGRPMYWVRLGGCGLECTWCDEPQTWVFDERHRKMHEGGKAYDPKAELSRVTVENLASRIAVTNYTTVAVTGGEPLLQQEAVGALIDHPLMGGMSFEFETAGVITPWRLAGYGNVRFNVSPKLASSGNPVAKRRNDAAIAALRALDSVFKFVLDTRQNGMWQADLTEVEYLTRQWDIPPGRVWVMPCGTTPGEVTEGMLLLEPVALARQWNLSSRLQVFMHGDARGF